MTIDILAGPFGEMTNEGNDGGASDGAAAEMDEVPVVGEAVIAGVLAHGRDGDAVAKRDGANGEGLEEM